MYLLIWTGHHPSTLASERLQTVFMTGTIPAKTCINTEPAVHIFNLGLSVRKVKLLNFQFTAVVGTEQKVKTESLASLNYLPLVDCHQGTSCDCETINVIQLGSNSQSLFKLPVHY